MRYILVVFMGGVLSFFGPWWIIGLVCFTVYGLSARPARRAFWTSALAGITVWLAYTMYLHLTSEVDLAMKVAGIFTAGIPAFNSIPGIVIILLVSALVSGLVSGFSGLAGAKARQFFYTKNGH